MWISTYQLIFLQNKTFKPGPHLQLSHVSRNIIAYRVARYVTCCVIREDVATILVGVFSMLQCSPHVMLRSISCLLSFNTFFDNTFSCVYLLNAYALKKNCQYITGDKCTYNRINKSFFRVPITYLPTYSLFQYSRYLLIFFMLYLK